MPSKTPSKSPTPRKSSAKTTPSSAGTVTPVPLSLVGSELARLRATAPLTHCLTNEVVQGITANVLLALGASPAMIVAEEEVTAFAGIAGAVLINVGTLYPERFAAMRRAAQAAQQAGTPWVLDPVAVGVLDYRTGAARELLAFAPAAIRGNASEILALAGFTGGGKGVDSTASADAAREAAEQLARDTGAIVAVTGETDYITDGEKTWAVPWGDALMTRVVGTGCALSAVVAAFCAGASNRLDAVAAACAVMAICGEVATGESHGPGSFTPAFLDALYLIQPGQLAGTVNA